MKPFAIAAIQRASVLYKMLFISKDKTQFSNHRADSMRRTKFTEEQIVAVLKERESGVNTAELCRKYGISEATFYNWKSKYGASENGETKRLKNLEDENTKLKRLLADAILDNEALRDLLTKKA